MTTPDLEALAREPIKTLADVLCWIDNMAHATAYYEGKANDDAIEGGDVLRALIRSAPAPGREEIAKIIMESMWSPASGSVSWTPEKIDAAEAQAGHVADAILAILALFHAPAEAGGGEARPAYAPLAVDHSTSVYEMPVAPTPPAGDGWRNPSQLWARDLTDEELIDEYRRNEEACDRFDEARRDPDYEGHGGSPGEGLYERNEELEGQLKKRGLWPLPPPPVSKGEKL